MTTQPGLLRTVSVLTSNPSIIIPSVAFHSQTCGSLDILYGLSIIANSNICDMENN